MTLPGTADPFAQFKHLQREAWAGFAVNEGFTTPPAAELVRFAGIGKGDRVLDAGCGTGVVAVTAARTGADVSGLDLTPELLERARYHAGFADVSIAFEEGDIEALPYADAQFDVVVSQFGHMFAPRPERAVSEMMRVLKRGGRIAFSTWPPEHGMGKLFALIARYGPAPADASVAAAPPWQWGDPHVVRERLGDAVRELTFDRAVAVNAVLSPAHAATPLVEDFGPLKKIMQTLETEPQRQVALRAEVLALMTELFSGNAIRQHFLMSRAVKK